MKKLLTNNLLPMVVLTTLIVRPLFSSKLLEKLIVFIFPALLVIGTPLLELNMTPISNICYSNIKGIDMLICNNKGKNNEKNDKKKNDKVNPGKDK